MLELIDNVENIKLTDKVKYKLEDSFLNYEEYLNKLNILELKYLKSFLSYIKQEELKNNQEVEHQDSFLIGLETMRQRKDSISLTMKYYKEGILTKEAIKAIHKQVIRGSSDDNDENYNFRSRYVYVGYFGTDGQKVIGYEPPNYEDIEFLLDKILNYLNKENKEDISYEIFLKPFIVHALLSCLQPFGNGNTRLARVIQHGKIWVNTNELLNMDLLFPSIYMSERYLKYRKQYRELLKDIANIKDDDAWNRWFMHNLYMVDEQVSFLSNKVDLYHNNLRR